MSREALGLAGARAPVPRPGRRLVGGWRGADGFPVRLRAADGDVAVDLVLERGKPVVVQGDRGWSQKGPEPGNASYYYSFTRGRSLEIPHVAGRGRAGRGLHPESGP